MKTYKILQWVTFACEAFLAIPFIGGAFVIGNGYIPLFVMFGLHIVTLIFANKEATIGFQRIGSIFGIITSCIAWIPGVGWLMHSITALILLISALRKDKNKDEDEFEVIG